MMMNEADIMDRLLRNPPDWLREYPICVAREWLAIPPYSQFGCGDLVFATEQEDSFLVVECKFLNESTGATARKSRNRARGKVFDQALKYGHIWAKKHPGSTVKACCCLNGRPPLHIIQIQDRQDCNFSADELRAFKATGRYNVDYYKLKLHRRHRP